MAASPAAPAATAPSRPGWEAAHCWGMLAAGMLPVLRPSRYGPFVVAVMGLIGLGLAALGLVQSLAVAVALTGLIGFALGYANLALTTWAQQRVPADLTGRVMSLILLGSVAAVPISSLVAGAVISVSLSGLLIVAGLLMTALALACSTTRAVRHMGLAALAARGPAGQPAPSPARRSLARPGRRA
jgi:hypothetical protein